MQSFLEPTDPNFSPDDVIVLEAQDFPRKWFFADWRDYGVYEDSPWWCIHEGTLSWPSLTSKITWSQRHRPARVLVFQARNKTQVNEYILNVLDEPTHHYGVTNQPQPGGSTMRSRDMKIEAARRTIEREQARIDALANLPEEPEDTEEGTCVVWFQRTFSPRGRVYTYAAVRAGDGLWYTTGPKGGMYGRSWDNLVEWIEADENDFPAIYLATEYEALN